MASLVNLTEEQKDQAFQRAKKEVKVDEGRLLRVTEEYYEKVIEFLQDQYHTDEPLHMSTGAKLGKDAREMYMREFTQNISVMILNDDGEVMASITNVIVKKGELLGEGAFVDDKLKTVWGYVNSCIDKANLLEHFNVNEAVQMANMATNRKYRRRGIGTQVIQASLAMIRNFGIDKVCAKAECSSKFSQKIFENVGMVCLYEDVYTDYEVGGKRVFEGTGIHNSLKILGMMVE